jgi:hypothetical protein
MSDESKQMRTMATAIEQTAHLFRLIDVEPLSPAHAVRLDQIRQHLDDAAGDLRTLADQVER